MFMLNGAVKGVKNAFPNNTQFRYGPEVVC